MNIHFDDKDLFDKLKRATIAKVLVGSHMYGTNNEKSDKDFLYIYATSENELTSAIVSNHQLQYKEDGVDHNFVSLHSFIRNTINGDSTINFEVIQSDSLIDTNLEWLSSYKDSFITYTVIRSYLGLAKRDLKHLSKASDELKKKRLGHIIRGFLYSLDMINKKFNFRLINNELIFIMKDLFFSKEVVSEYEAKINLLRNELNDKLNNKTLGLSQHMNVEDAINITKSLNYFCKSGVFKNCQEELKDFDMSYFMNAFENWVDYN